MSIQAAAQRYKDHSCHFAMTKLCPEFPLSLSFYLRFSTHPEGFFHSLASSHLSESSLVGKAAWSSLVYRSPRKASVLPFFSVLLFLTPPPPPSSFTSSLPITSYLKRQEKGDKPNKFYIGKVGEKSTCVLQFQKTLNNEVHRIFLKQEIVRFILLPNLRNISFTYEFEDCVTLA